MAIAEATSVLRHDACRAAVSAIKALQAQSRDSEARERYGDIVAWQQQRALRIAFRYLRDVADAEEVVQDAFGKAYAHLASFREELLFEAWLTRILINGCLDRRKARRRRERCIVSDLRRLPGEERFWDRVPSRVSTEERLIARERRETVARALARLPARQRSVLLLSHCEGLTSPEVGARTGLKASSVRVHLFRAIRTLRRLLAEAGPSDAGATSTATA